VNVKIIIFAMLIRIDNMGFILSMIKPRNTIYKIRILTIEKIVLKYIKITFEVDKKI